MTVLISIEGVLRTEVGDPIHQGMKIFRQMMAGSRIVFSTDGTVEEAEHWLRANLIKGYADILGNNSAFEGQDLKVRHINLLQAMGKIDLFIDPDVDRCKYALSLGITTMLFATPKFVRTKRVIRPWSELQEELEAQKKLVAKIVLDGPLDRWE